MATKLQHISPEELLIHPGETIQEVIQDRNITQKELAIRTGFTEKHISTVINGQKNISAEFAMKLEYALGIPASFWRNLQTNYDLEVVAFNEKHNISLEEKKIAKEVKDTVEILTNNKIKSNSGLDSVYYIRQLLGVSNLKAISTLNSAQYRAQFVENTSENIMYTWQYLCEKKVENQTDNKLDIDKLINNLDRIKNIMHEDAEKHIDLIREVLNECGILFTVEKQVKNAPINGLTVRTKKDQVMIALTIRGKYADIFWFTLFHELAHVFYKDYLKNQSIWEKDNVIEKRADEFARDQLIDKTLYKEFTDKYDFSIESINRFAVKNNVLPTIVIGRLMKDKFLPWNYSNHRDKYNWIGEDE